MTEGNQTDAKLGELLRELAGAPSRCLEKRPEDRFQTARALADALRGLVEAAAQASSGQTATVEGAAPAQRPPEPAAPLASGAPRGAATAPAGGRTAPSQRAALRVLALAAAVALAAAAAVWLARRAPPAGAAGEEAKAASSAAVAVLPFADLSPLRDQDYFSDGITEEILDALARVPGLRVAGRTSSFSFKGSAEDVRAIGRKLGVGTVLEGSVRRAGSRARISAKMVNVVDGFTVWSQAYDRELTDVFAVQEEIARAVALGPTFASAWNARALLRALLRWDFQGGRQDFERALSLAGGDASVLRDYGTFALVPLGRVEEGLAAMERAAGLDPLDPMVWWSLASTWPAKGDHERAARAAERALEVSPNNNIAALWRAVVAIVAGRPAEGLALAKRHLASPGAWIERNRLMVEALAQHSLGDAQASRQALAQLEAGYALGYAYQIGTVHAWRGEHDEAFAWLERAIAQQDTGAVFITRDPLLRSLRGDPRYAVLLRKMNLPAK